MNYLPYFIPLIREGNKRNIKSIMFYSPSKKYFTSPDSPKHRDELDKLASIYDFKLLFIKNITKYPGVTFFCEGDIVGKEDKKKPSPNFKYLTKDHIKVSIICNYEYVMFYKDYIDNVDYVICIDKFWCQHFETMSPKNLYLGSPKYDMDYFDPVDNREDGETRDMYLKKKYNLDMSQKYILIVYPKDPKKHHKSNTLYPNKDFMLQLYNGIREMGYKVIVKTRKQDPIKDKELQGDYYFEDIDFYPCNSMELIELSRMVIYFSSSINEECVVMKTPYLDIAVDQKKIRFELLNYTPFGNVWPITNFQYSSKETLEQRISKFIVFYEQMHYRPDVIDSNRIFQTYYTKMLYNGNEKASKRIVDWVKKVSK